MNSMVTPFYLVPDEDRGRDSDDLIAQVHLGTSDIPDILGVGVGGCHYGRTLFEGVHADLGDGLLPAALGPQAGTCWGITGLIFIPLVTLSSGVDSRSRSFLIPKTDCPFVPSLCAVLSFVLTLL